MLNDLQLISGVDIPFVEAQIIIHQPTIKEIAFIGEDNFFYGCELLKFSKDMLNVKDKNSLDNYSDFDILMSIMENKDKNESIQKSIECAYLVLNLIFPGYVAQIMNYTLVLTKENEPVHIINNKNFDTFKQILSDMFNLQVDSTVSNDYSPSGALAQKIADKLKKRHQKLAEQKGGNGQKITVFSRYISILTVGEHKDMNSFMNYTVYQLLDEFKRFSLKEQYDMYIKAKLQGAKDLKEVEDWMKDIHTPDTSNMI